jgi:Pentapeptide repeats (9 copies)/Protein tyrosine and serine/threonine kinase
MTNVSPSSPPRGLAKGDQVAGATLVEPISEGERLSCWRAKREDGSPATVHLLTKSADPRERKNFLEGARALQSLSRSRPIEGIIEIVAIEAMDLACVGRGGAVGSMEDIGVLGWGTAETVAFIRRLCRALGALHAAGVVHGCLRPANVLIDSELCPRACDVGMLVIDDSYDGPSDMKHDYSAYASREVRLGEKPVVQSDIFSVGRLLSFALLDQEPEANDDDLPVLDELAGEPAGLVRIVRRCTTREKTKRYPDMDALTRDLERWQSVEEVGLSHPKGREGAVEQIEEPPSSRRGRESSRGRDSVPPAAPSGEGTPEPPPAARLSVTLRADQEEDDDVLTPSQARLGGLLGGVIIAGVLVFAYVSAVATTVTMLGLMIGAVGLGLAMPVLGGAPIGSRVVLIGVLAATAWFTNPDALAAEAGRRAKLTKGAAPERAARVKRLASRGFTNFEGIDFAGLDFNRMNLQGVRFSGCRLAGANFKGANLSGVSFARADLAGAHFAGADLSGVAIVDALNWRQSTCDDDTVMPGRWICEDGAPAAENVAMPGVNRGEDSE